MMEITVHNLIDIAEHLKQESKKYRHGLVERIHREGSIDFHIHDYQPVSVSREIHNKVSVSKYKVGRVILKGDEPIFIIEE